MRKHLPREAARELEDNPAAIRRLRLRQERSAARHTAPPEHLPSLASLRWSNPDRPVYWGNSAILEITRLQHSMEFKRAAQANSTAWCPQSEAHPLQQSYSRLIPT